MAIVASERNMQGQSTAEDIVKEEVFKQTYIPQRLDEVSLLNLLSHDLLFITLKFLGHVFRKRY